jgi:hypothetical protein
MGSCHSIGVTWSQVDSADAAARTLLPVAPDAIAVIVARYVTPHQTLETRFSSDDDFVDLDGIFVPSRFGRWNKRLRKALDAECMRCLQLLDPLAVRMSGAAQEALVMLQHRLTDPTNCGLLPFAVPPAVLTTSSKDITATLVQLACTLSSLKGFTAQESKHSRVVIGPSGSGKTVALKRNAIVISLLFDMCVVYFNARDCAAESHPFSQHGGIIEALLHVLGPDQDDALATPSTEATFPIDMLRTVSTSSGACKNTSLVSLGAMPMDVGCSATALSVRVSSTHKGRVELPVLPDCKDYRKQLFDKLGDRRLFVIVDEMEEL